MKRMQISFTMGAVLLAVLLPLEQAQCAWMGIGRQAPTAQRAVTRHACCARAAAAQAQHGRAPQSDPFALPPCCACVQLPPGAMPTLATPADLRPAAGVTVMISLLSVAPPAVTAAPATMPMLGSPPLPEVQGAHGPRAPPRSA